MKPSQIKILASLLFVLILTSCTKEKSSGLTYPLTSLPGSTWKTFSFTGVLDKKDFYLYLHFTNSTSVDIYTADANGNNVVSGKVTYQCKITLSDSHIDTFEIFYPNNKSGTGFTTSNSTQINYNGDTYTKVN